MRIPEVWAYSTTSPQMNFASPGSLQKDQLLRLIEVEVEGRDSGTQVAFAYVACRVVKGKRPSAVTSSFAPEGAVEHDLPASYLAELERHRAAWAPPGAGYALNFVVSSVEWVRSYSPASLEARRNRRRGFPDGE
ncbi:MAG: hypothetical protein R3B07_09725 [Polyangiaceae bacterium]